MRVAIVGSRSLTVDRLGDYLPDGVTEIVSGGARGVDSCARDYALQNGLKLTEFKPEYRHYGNGAPIVRNRLIVEYADVVIAFWDGKSSGTKFVIEYCKKLGKELRVYRGFTDDETAALEELEDYQQYSKPMLKLVAELEREDEASEREFNK